MIERFRRPTYGGLVIEFVCIDKSAQHYVGASGKPK